MTDDATLSDFDSATPDEDSATEASRADGESIPADGETVPADGEAIPADNEPSPEGGETAEAVADADDIDAGQATPSDETGLSTYAWGEYTCSQCAATTDRVWRADGSLVCPDCKEW